MSVNGVSEGKEKLLFSLTNTINTHNTYPYTGHTARLLVQVGE